MLGQDDFYPQVARLLSSYQCRPSGLPENLLEHKIWSINKLKTYLLARGYNNNFLEEQFLRAANISRTNALQTKPKASNDVVPFVVTYNPALPRISNILGKHFNILHSSNRCKDVFEQPPFVAYRRRSNFRDF